MGAVDRAGVLLRTGEIAAHARFDNLLQPKARGAGDVPYSHDAITAEWLTAVLCRNAPGAEILNVVTCGGSVGSSTRHALALTRNRQAIEAGIPERLFVKSTPILMQRLLLGLSKVIYGEVGFYMHFRPQIDIEAPLGYFACVAPRSLRSMILMEDVVVTRGAAFNTQGDAINKEDMADLLGGLARLHAGFWGATNLAAEHPWLRDTRTYLRDNNRLIDMKHWVAVGTEQAGELVPQALRGRVDDIWAGILACNARAAREPMTLLHGDAHIAQTYRTKAGRMGLSDWQVLLRGHWAWDVSYIVTTGLETDDRRAWEADLLRHCMAELAAAGGPELTFNQAWDAYRANILYAYAAWAFTIGHNSAVQAVQPEITTERLVQRTAHAIHDLDAVGAALRA